MCLASGSAGLKSAARPHRGPFARAQVLPDKGQSKSLEEVNFQCQWENLKLSWLPHLVPMKKFQLFIPWWLEIGAGLHNYQYHGALKSDMGNYLGLYAMRFSFLIGCVPVMKRSLRCRVRQRSRKLHARGIPQPRGTR